jgi:thiamine-monophosphate kinase
MDEFGIIAEIFAPLAMAPFAFGLKDDAAAIPPPPGFDLVVTTDQIAEGTDFFKHDPPHTIAQKALRVNLSDLAAKGAGPKYYLLNIALPEGMTPEWLGEFAQGLKADQDRWGLSLIGGDTSRTEGPLSIAITAFGFVPAGRMVRRAGARPGDAVYVTGEIGMSAGGLALFKREKHALSEQDRDALVARYRVPEPPVDFGPALMGRASAAIDVSDGLVADLTHLARASGVAVTLEGDTLPIPAFLKNWWGEGAIARAATSGDDYQIAFTADPAQEIGIRDFACQTDVSVTRIGTVAAGEGVTLLVNGQVAALPRPGFRHF